MENTPSYDKCETSINLPYMDKGNAATNAINQYDY